MADDPCHKDPNFAVICSFMSRYGCFLGIRDTNFCDLQRQFNNTTDVPVQLFNLLWMLLKRICKSATSKDKWQRQLTKFCYTYSSIDGWEMEQCGFPKCKTETKLRIIKNMIEAQFDKNAKFKEKINALSVNELRYQPMGRDNNGLEYWYLMDDELNMLIYREDKDDVDSETWELIVKDREDLAELIDSLGKSDGLKEESRSTSPSSDKTEPKDLQAVDGLNTDIKPMMEVKKENEAFSVDDQMADTDNNTTSEPNAGKVDIDPQSRDFMDHSVTQEDSQVEYEGKDKCTGKDTTDTVVSECSEVVVEFDRENGSNDVNSNKDKCSETSDNDMITENTVTSLTTATTVDKDNNEDTVEVKEMEQGIPRKESRCDGDKKTSVECCNDDNGSCEKGHHFVDTNTESEFEKDTQKPKEAITSSQTEDSDGINQLRSSPRRSSRSTKGQRPAFLQILDTPRSRKAKAPEEGVGRIMKKRDKIQGKSAKREKRGRWKRDTSSSNDSSDSEFEALLHSQNEEDDDDELTYYHQLTDEEPTEEDDTEYEPKGRNARRTKAIKESVINDDTPCTKCGKYKQPEWILLCDKCDAGYHTACLRPPLMVVPDGDWFCPPCEHALLIAILQDKLVEFDKQYKEKERIIMRKKRLAYVGISLDNVLKPGDIKQQRKANKENIEFYDSQSSSDDDRFSYDPSTSGEEAFNFLKQRTCRTRKEINYQFTEYDEMIKQAVAEGEEYSELDKEVQEIQDQQSPAVVEGTGCNLGQGKDMSTITGKSERPSPVMKKARKRKSRRLCSLDVSDDEAEDDDEYQASNDSDPDASYEEAVSEGDLESEDSFMASQQRSSRRTSRRKTGRKRKGYQYDDFVVDEEDSDDDNRRSAHRKSKRKRVSYRDWSEEDDEEDWSDNSQSKTKTKKDTLNDLVMRRNKNRKTNKHRYESDSDWDNSHSGSDDIRPRKAAAKVNFKSMLASDSDEEDHQVIKRFKKKSVIESEEEYDTESNDDKEEEEEGDDDEGTPGGEEDADGEEDNDYQEKAQGSQNTKKNKPIAEQYTKTKKPVNGASINAESPAKSNAARQQAPSVSPGSGFMIDNLLKGTKNCPSQNNSDVDDDLSDISDIVSYVTGPVLQ